MSTNRKFWLFVLPGLLVAFCFIRSGRSGISLCSAQVPCWMRCRNPVVVSELNGLVEALSSTINARLTVLARVSGFFTTPMFKMNGVQGWHDYRELIRVKGEVKQVGHSLDGMTTVDMKVESISTTGEWAAPEKEKFLRMEIFNYVARQLHSPLIEGERVEVEGKLMWDGDGFLEVHPLSGAQILIRN